MKFYSGKEDCDWIKATALRHIFVAEAFQSFILHGNEDCPSRVELYSDVNPDYDATPVLTLTLWK